MWLADDLWPTTADPGELDSALLNLVIDSRDAMPDGGEIIVMDSKRAPGHSQCPSLVQGRASG